MAATGVVRRRTKADGQGEADLVGVTGADHIRNGERTGSGLAVFCYVVFLFGWILDQTNLVPGILIRALAVVGVCTLLFFLLTFKRWSDEIEQLPRFCWCMVAMILELAVENFLVWVVSATDLRKYERVPGLQDNVEIVLRKISVQHPLLKFAVRFHWAHIFHFLAAILGLAFSVLWEQVPYSGFGMMARVTLTICLSRIIRTVCFMVTILPNPRPGCYRSRFPPVPGTALEFIAIGFEKMKGTGGCNDLIFSGHCGIWTIAPLAYQSYYTGRCCWLLWLALLQTSIRTVVEHHHYSVDMVLAVVITGFVWHQLDWVCPTLKPLRRRPKGSIPDSLSPSLALFVSVIVVLVVFFVVKSGS